MNSRKERLSLHIPSDLAEWVEKEAENDKRSVNNFVIKILDDRKRQVENGNFVNCPKCGTVIYGPEAGKEG